VSAGGELDAAGITDPEMRAAYLRCRVLNARHGRTYFLATRLLTPGRRPSVHALYGFARLADDVVDGSVDGTATGKADTGTADTGNGSSGSGSAAERQRRLGALERQLADGLAAGHSDHPVIAALVHTVYLYGIDHSYFRDFLASMRMDLVVTDYPTMADLAGYMRGSAEVIGLQMLPVLGTRGPRAEAEPAAMALGTAFQLTNFLRDVGEDLDRGRVYLPADVLSAHGVDRELLTWSRFEGTTHRRIRAALADLVGHTREVYRTAAAGIPLLAPRSRACVHTAFRLYSAILDLLEQCDYDVMTRRVVVPRRRRLAVALPALARSTAAGWTGRGD